MNDFTKEELEIIREGMDDTYQALPVVRTFMKKVQSMIDNYCEHDESGGEVEVFVDTCSKCNAFMLREKYYEDK